MEATFHRSTVVQCIIRYYSVAHQEELAHGEARLQREQAESSTWESHEFTVSVAHKTLNAKRSSDPGVENAEPDFLCAPQVGFDASLAMRWKREKSRIMISGDDLRLHLPD